METVAVACKIPNGVRAQLRDVRGVVTQEHVFKGPPKPLVLIEQSFEQELRTGGYGITEGVPKEFWDKWEADNAGNHMLTGSLVMSGPDAGSLLSMAREMGAIRSGMEAADPENPAPGLEKATVN